MSTLDLVFDCSSYAVPRHSIVELLNHQPALSDARAYAVRSSVSRAAFEAFVNSLKTQTKISVTRENAVSLWLLAKEFWISELAAACAASTVPVPEFALLSERVCELEARVSSLSIPGRIEDEIESQEEGLESVRLALERLKTWVEGELNQLVTSKPSSSPQPSASASPKTVQVPMREDAPMEGIISHLTKKHGGNVHEKGIVTITSKSMVNDSDNGLKNLAELTDYSAFASEDGPGQWLCWDFGEMCVRPSHYTIRGGCLKSWIVEGSLDGVIWREIDRQTDSGAFPGGWEVASFPVSTSMECRFIRLVQMGPNRMGYTFLLLLAVEFFGMLSE
jgi:hypothetical protein